MYPSFRQVTIITPPSDGSPNKVLNLLLEEFIYKLIEDHFLDKGAQFYLTFTPENTLLNFKTELVKVRYVKIVKANGVC